MLKDGVTTEMRMDESTCRSGSGPAAANRRKFVKKFQRTRDIVGRRKSLSPNMTGIDKPRTERCVGIKVRNRGRNAGGVARFTKQCSISQLLFRSRNTRRYNGAAECKSFQRRQIFGSAPRDICQRKCPAIERNQNVSFDEPEKMHLFRDSQASSEIRNKLSIPFVRTDERERNDDSLLFQIRNRKQEIDVVLVRPELRRVKHIRLSRAEPLDHIRCRGFGLAEHVRRCR